MNLLLQFGIIKSLGWVVKNTFKQINFLPLGKFLNNKIIKNASIPVIIPGDQLVLKIFHHIPISSKKNLNKLIYYKIQTDVLPDLQKLKYFYVILNKNSKNREYTIAVFFYKDQLLDNFNKTVETNNIFPESFIFDICLFIEYLRNIKSRSTELYIQSFENYSYISIKKKDSLQYIRIINSSAAGLKKAIQDTIQYYKKIDPDADIKDINLLNTKIDLKLKEFKIKQIPVNENNLAVLAFKSSIPELIYNKSKKEVVLNKILNFAFKTALFILTILFILLFFNLSIKDKIKLYQTQIKTLEPSFKIIKPLQEKEKKYNKIKALQNKILPLQSVVSSVLLDFSKAVPGKIRLKNLFYENDSLKFRLEGYANDINIINSFVNKLNDKFKKVELISTEQEKFGEENLVAFAIGFRGKKEISGFTTKE